jgi:hypothetical protein
VDESHARKVKNMKVYKGIFMPWNPVNTIIEIWWRTKELECVQKESINLNLTLHKYLDKYVFSELHEVFFCDFPHLLQEWLLRLKENHPMN